MAGIMSESVAQLSLDDSSSKVGQESQAKGDSTSHDSVPNGIHATTSAADALVDPSPLPSGPAPTSVPAQHSDPSSGSSTSVAEIYKPEASDASTSVLDPASARPPPGLTAQDAKLQAIAAIKCRDFASSPPPQRPQPTALGRDLATSTQLNGTKGMASAPAVHTLASNPSPNPGGLPSSSSSSPGAGASTPSLGASASGSAQAARPPAVTRPSQLGTGAPAARRPGQGGSGALATRIPPSLQAKMAALASRSNNPTSITLAQNTHLGAGERIQTSSLFKNSSSSSGMPSGSGTGSTQLPGGIPSLAGRPSPAPSAPGGRVGAMGPVSGRTAMPGMPGAAGLGRRRGPGAGLTLGQMGMSASAGGSDSASGSSTPATNGARRGPPGKLPGGLPGAGPADGGGANGSPQGQAGGHTAFSNFSKIVDPSGSLNFQNKAVLHAKGVDFSNGSSFKINMDDLELQDELGSGNYGTVQKVYHKVTKVTMAMKEIRLELDDSKLKGIITELDILHRATAPEIVDFYGAFFIESCVYYCMEFMDAGSLDKFAGITVPEPVLKRVTASMVRGLKFLKDELQTMHRDVKPTNVLVNTNGAIKLCDFGVSGQLERSLAKTNIGCQSYMAPERIKGESLNFLGTYTVSSDVWSLGLSIIEFAVGHYPYPPETYSNVFAQLQAIVHGDPPALPDGYSKEADDFVAGCLRKDANKRPSYGQMLQHPFLKDERTLDLDMSGWVKEALATKQRNRALNASTSSTSSSASSSTAGSAPAGQ